MSKAFLLAILAALVLLANAGYRNSYSKREIKALNKFRPRAQNYLTLDYQKTDAYLLRWIKNSNFDLSAAIKELQKHYEWRRDNSIDSILDEDCPLDLPYTVDGVDRGGRPIAFHPFGKWNLRKYVREGEQDVVVRQYQRMYEEAIRQAFTTSQYTGQDIDQIYVLTDMAGYSLLDHSCIRCVPITLRFTRSFNAGVMPFAKNITLVNSPIIFRPVLSLARTVIRSVPVTSYNRNRYTWMQKLLEDISPDQLPEELGGTGSHSEVYSFHQPDDYHDYHETYDAYSIGWGK